LADKPSEHSELYLYIAMGKVGISICMYSYPHINL